MLVSSPLPANSPAPAPSGASPERAVAPRDILFGLKRPGFLRLDEVGVRAWMVAGAPTGYASVNDAIDAARGIVARDAPSIAVLRDGDRFNLRYLMQFHVVGGSAWGMGQVREEGFRMPLLQSRDAFRYPSDALQAIVDLDNGVTTRERIEAAA